MELTEEFVNKRLATDLAHGPLLSIFASTLGIRATSVPNHKRKSL
jgi:hypothetical protein